MEQVLVFLSEKSTEVQLWLSSTLAPALRIEEITQSGALVPLAVFGGSIFLVILWLARPRPSRFAAIDLKKRTRKPRMLGLATVVLFAGGLAAWSFVAPLASASIAQGVISPDGSIKTVKHLEGGIVKAIHVEEGQRVQAGDTLVVLEDVAAKARRDELRERLHHLWAREARLVAEANGASEVLFPDALLNNETGDTEIVDVERALFLHRRATQEGSEGILDQRNRQLATQNRGLSQVIEAQTTQIALIEEEIVNVESLLESGLARYSRLLALKREKADLEASRAENDARLLENGQKIEELSIQLAAVREEFAGSVSAELTDVRRMIAELNSALPSREDILERTTIRAPISGAVLNLSVKTVSGVVGAGETVLEIVPEDTPLVVDARVRPSDIDRVYPGMSARVILSAYKQRGLPMIYGTLHTISADRIVEDRTGEPYFLAKVEVSPEGLAKLEGVKMLPGMPAEVMLLDGERTLVDYLLDPIVSSLDRSFKEG